MQLNDTIDVVTLPDCILTLGINSSHMQIHKAPDKTSKHFHKHGNSLQL